MKRSPHVESAALYAICVLGAIAVSAIIVAASGGSARGVFSALIDGSVRNDGAWGATLTTSAPLLFVALGAIVSNRAGLVNIGQEGQLLLGAIAAAYLGNHVGSGGPHILVLALAGAALAGALWAAIAAALRYVSGVPEVLSTLLLVSVSFFVLNYGLSNTWFLLDTDPAARQQLNSGTRLASDTRLPGLEIFGNRISIGILIGAVLAGLVAMTVYHTVIGFRLRMLGLNARTAQRAGVSAVALGTGALVVSGAFAGLGGGVLLTGQPDYRITLDFSRGFGWDGLLVALLARDKPLVAIPMALVFGALRTGALYLAATGVSSTIVDVVKAMIVLALFIPPAIEFIRSRRRVSIGAEVAA